MNTINNVKTLRPMITFDFDEPVVYQIQITKRRKENPDIKKNAKTLKHFFLYSEDDLDALCPKIIDMCNANRARAYINVEAKSLRAIGHQMVALTNDYLYKGEYKAMQNVFVKAYGRKASSVVSKKRWVLDADDYSLEKTKALKSFVQTQHGFQKGNTEEPLIVPTPNGYHLICQGFNPRSLVGSAFEDLGLIYKNNGEIECESVKKHAPTILYAAW